MQAPMLVAMSGLPGVGKSSIARALARELDVCLIELDRIEAPLLARISGDTLGWGGYDILTALADDHLAQRHSVILDSVTWTRQLRARWHVLAADSGAAFRPIEVVCSDVALHRSRLQARRRGSRGLTDPPWTRVEEARRLYEAWDSPRLVLDTIQPLDELIRAAVDYCRQTDLTTPM